eukprot:scaffold26275_cov132-Skeletonema_dohrnii-CCMP3373.AAC.1
MQRCRGRVMQRQRRHLSTPAVAAFCAPVGIKAAIACFERRWGEGLHQLLLFKEGTYRAMVAIWLIRCFLLSQNENYDNFGGARLVEF